MSLAQIWQGESQTCTYKRGTMRIITKGEDPRFLVRECEHCSTTFEIDVMTDEIKHIFFGYYIHCPLCYSLELVCLGSEHPKVLLRVNRI